MTLKTLRNNFRQILHPNAVLPVKINGQSVPQGRIVALFAFFTLFMVMILVTAAIMLLSGIDMVNSVVIALSCVSNIGPSLDNDIGAAITWSGPWNDPKKSQFSIFNSLNSQTKRKHMKWQMNVPR